LSPQVADHGQRLGGEILQFLQAAIFLLGLLPGPAAWLRDGGDLVKGQRCVCFAAQKEVEK
jgi:hypothetical protein